MECLYSRELSKSDTIVRIAGEEAKHLKALRLKAGDSFFVVNGEGLAAKAVVDEIDKGRTRARITEFYEEFGEPSVKIALAIGILKDRNRFEFAVEKAIELGVSEIFPLITERSQKKEVNLYRLRAKSIAAIKQSMRSRIPIFHSPIKIDKVEKKFDKFPNIVLADAEGFEPDIKNIRDDILVLVGPEGGFSPEELSRLKANEKLSLWRLSARRLRTETAAVSALSIISSFIR